MTNNEVPQGRIGIGLRRMFAAAFVAAAVIALTVSLGSADAAKLIGKDGTVNACYKAGGKGKGAVRLVAKNQRCKRGERKVTWGLTGPEGPRGGAGQAGAVGLAGPAGATGAAGLEAQVTELTKEVEVLQQTLQGVTNDSLTQALATVNGISNAELDDVLSQLPSLDSTVSGLSTAVDGLDTEVESLCTQAPLLTDQVNAVSASLDGVVDGLLGSLIGGLFDDQEVPDPLSDYTCESD